MHPYSVVTDIFCRGACGPDWIGNRKTAILDMTQSPTRFPTASPTTPKPTASPTTPRPSASPTTPLPTSSPPCHRPALVDIAWVIDGSSSMDPILPDPNTDHFKDLTSFMEEFSLLTSMSSAATRQGFVEFAGPLHTFPDVYRGFQTIGPYLNLSSPEATKITKFIQQLQALFLIGGTTDLAGALDFVRTVVFNPGNRRPGSRRIVVLAGDGRPSDRFGRRSDQAAADAEAAMDRLKQEDGIYFVFLRIGSDYPARFFESKADYIYDATFPTLKEMYFVSPSSTPTTTSPSKAPSPGLSTLAPSRPLSSALLRPRL